MVCGLYMAAKKRPKFDGFVADARALGLDVVDLDLDSGASADCLDAILHNFTDDIATADRDAGAARRLANFETLLASNPHAVLIDPLAGIRPLLNRADMQRTLADIIHDFQIDAALPKWVTIPANSSTPNITAALQAAGLCAPFLCKSEAACGVSYSHDMAVFSDARQLEQYAVPPPFTIQEFRNHAAVVLKIYVLGAQWFVHPGPSIADTEATTDLIGTYASAHATFTTHSPSDVAKMFNIAEQYADIHDVYFFF